MSAHEFTVNGAKYLVHKHRGMEGMHISAALTATMAPVMAGMMNIDEATGNAIPPTPAQFGAAFAAALDRDDWPKLMRRILANTSRNGHPLRDEARLNEAFTGNYHEAWMATMEVVKINGFLPELDTFMGEFSNLLMGGKPDTELSEPSK